jgi:hypothetical protein
MKIKIRNEKVIDVQDWDNLVEKTYGKPYSFQQQDGCQSRGNVRFSVPADTDDFERESVPEEVNHETMGVSFKAWLKRNPKLKLKGEKDCQQWCIDLWWQRNFYPEFQMIANDLHAKGLLEAGDYTINIDW